MSRDVRLSGIDHGYLPPDAFPPPRVRMRISVPRQPSLEEHAASVPTTSAGDVDNLREARGIVYSALLGGGLWILIGLLAWFIAR
jgi:hypothetical protein